MVTDRTENLNKEEMEKSNNMDLDRLLVEEIGQFGKYQFKMVVLIGIAAIFSSWGYSYVFTTARINTRCYIPGCDTEIETPVYAPLWISNAIPVTSETKFDQCRRFANETTINTHNDTTCPSAAFNRDITVPCDRYVYEDQNTVVYEFDLACNEWRRSFIGTMRTLGVLVGFPFAGYLSDRWGRRTALVILSFNTAWMGLLRLTAQNYIGFISSEFLEATFGTGYTCAYILLVELVGPKYRVTIGAIMNSLFATGQMLMGLFAWGLPYWRHLTLILYVPQLFTILYLWVISESIRWYMSQGRYEESEAVLKEVAKSNGKQLTEKSLQALRDTAEQEKKNNTDDSDEVKEPWLVVLVFRHKPILIRCLVAPIWWISATLIYYGLSVNAVNLSGNRYLNFIAVSAIEIPGCWLAVVMMNKVGRKPVLIVGYWLCAVCQLGYIIMPTGYWVGSLSLYLLGKCSITLVTSSIYTYTGELFPTHCRHRLFAFCSMVGRLGSIAAPLTPALGVAVWSKFPFALFAAFGIISGILVFITPETLGSKFPETMEEAANLGKKEETRV